MDNKQSNIAAPNPKGHSCWSWFLGILFIISFSTILLTYGGYLLTSEKIMKPMIAKTLNIVLRHEGTKETVRAVNYVNELYKQRNAIKAFTELDPTKVEQDVSQMPPEQSEKYLEDNLVGPMYENGTKIIEPLKMMNPDAAVDTERLDLLSMINGNSNKAIKKILFYEAITTGILLLLLLIASSGRRVSTIGFVILLASLPGVLFFGLFNKVAGRLLIPVLGQYADGPIYKDILNEVINPIIITMRNIHIVPAAIGLFLILLAFILKLIFRSRSA